MNKNLKIALIVDQPSWTGIGVYAHQLYSLIKDYFEEVSLIYLGAHIDNSKKYLELPYIKHSTSWIEYPYIIKENYKLFIKDERFKGYLKHYLGASYFPFAVKEEDIVTIHDLIKDDILKSVKYGLRPFLTSISRNLNRKKMIKVIKNNPTAIAISKKGAKDILNLTGAQAHVIYHWIDDDRFKPRNEKEIKNLLHLDLKTKYILSVGNNRPNKRIDLIRKFAELLPSDWKIMKIGEKIISNKIENLGIVQDQLYPYYFNASKAYLHLSDDEGFGIPLLESMGSGIPIIARNNEINREIIGDYGIFISDDEINKIAIKDILNKIEDESYKSNLLEIRKKKLLWKGEAKEKYIKIYENKFMNL